MPWWFMLKKEYQSVYVLGGLAGIILVIFACIFTSINANNFDKEFDAGEFTISSNVIGLGEQGSPLEIDTDLFIPYGYSLEDHPRLFEITGCEEYLMSRSKVHAAAPSIASSITISVPDTELGDVQICVPQALEDVPVILWVSD